MEVTYDMLKPILITESMEGNVLKCVFKAQNQVQPVEAQFVFTPEDRDQLAHPGKETFDAKPAKRNFFSSLKSVFTGSGSNGAGGNAAGHAVLPGAHGVYQSGDDVNARTKVQVSEEKRQEGVVYAFKNVESNYFYENGTWIFKQ